MLEAVKAVQKSASKLRKLQQGANHLFFMAFLCIPHCWESMLSP
jgi:hypothetical protein